MVNEREIQSSLKWGVRWHNISTCNEILNGIDLSALQNNALWELAMEHTCWHHTHPWIDIDFKKADLYVPGL